MFPVDDNPPPEPNVTSTTAKDEEAVALLLWKLLPFSIKGPGPRSKSRSFQLERY